MEFNVPSIEENSGVLPEPRRVKKEMLWWRKKTHQAAEQFSNNRHQKNFKTWKGAILKWYMNVLPFLDEMSAASRDYSVLEGIERWTTDGKRPEEQELWKYTRLLEFLMKDLGVTNIGVERPTGEWGYDYLQGLPYSSEVERENEGWRRLKENMRNIRQTLKIDTDFMGIIWGPNRVGKDTLAQQLVIPEGQEPRREQYVMNDDDFWTAVEQEQYFSFYVTEMSDHFYTQDVHKRSQKKKKRKLKKYAKKNMLVVGCDINFWKIDREVINDKVSFAIHIPRRGSFEFYTKNMVEQFERGDNRGEVETPEPAFTGRFPKLTADDPRWSMYQDIEDEKLDVEQDEVEEDEVNVEQIIQKVKDRIDHFKKPYGDSYILQKGVLKREFKELRGNKEAMQMVKDSVENDMGWRDE